MTYFKAQDMLNEDRDAFIEWLVTEGLNPEVIVDDGRTSVHNGRISWREFVLREDGSRVQGVKVPHFKWQETPLPDRFL